MGFNLHINNILRIDFEEKLEIGKEYSFEKDLSILVDDIEIWLIKKDWTALAEIKITSQTRKGKKTFGTFKVLYIYNEEEQKALTKIFKRMYGWK